MNFEEVKDKILMILINTKENAELLSQVPHRNYMDLSIVYQIDTGVRENMLLSNLNMSQMGIEETTLHDAALLNTKTERSGCIASLHNVISGIIDGEYGGVDAANDTLDADELYVVSNRQVYFGAIALVVKTELEQLAENLESNLYILPSSVHEVIAVSDRSIFELEELRKVVLEANNSVVNGMDFLSDQIYFYDQKLKELSILQESPSLDKEETAKKAHSR